MFFRQRGSRTQCLRSVYSSKLKKRQQVMLFSFSTAVDSLSGFDPTDLKKLTPLEMEDLRLYFEKDEKMVVDLTESIRTLIISMKRPSFKKDIEFKWLRSAMNILQNNIKEISE